MEVRHRRKSSVPSSNVKTEAVYSSQNNYGFNKANKTLGNTPGGLNMTRHSTAELAVGELDAQRSSESINADQYLDDSAVQYPDSIGTFADGLKGDIFELFETGAKVLNKSFKLLLPFGSESSGSGATDIMRDIEIRSPLANVTNKTSIKSNSRPTNSKSPFKTAEDAIRMRCSSMWKKETPMNSASEPFLPMPPKNLFPPMPQNNTGIRVKEGVKVQLNKLNTGNGSIQSFECCDDSLLLVGNRRIILAAKNHDEGNTGTVVWSQPLHDIDSCTITFNSNPSITSPTKVHLELSTQGGRLIRKVSMPNTLVCSRALQVIQDRKVRSKIPDAIKNDHRTQESEPFATLEPAQLLGLTRPNSADDDPLGDGRRLVDLTSSEELAKSISAVIAATRGTADKSSYVEGIPGAATAGSARATTPFGNTIHKGSSKKSPELVAADALIADITAILRNLELKSGSAVEKDECRHNRNVAGQDGRPAADSEVVDDGDCVSPMKRMCYNHIDKDFSGAIAVHAQGNASPQTGILLHFTPSGNTRSPLFSHGTASPLSPIGEKTSSARKRGKAKKRSCLHHSRINHGSPHLDGGFCCNHPECVDAAEPIHGATGQNLNCKHTEVVGPIAALGVEPSINCGTIAGEGVSLSRPVDPTTSVKSTESITDIDKFKKMLGLGVPLGAVKQKMLKEGFNPDLLNNAPLLTTGDVAPSKAEQEIKSEQKEETPEKKSDVLEKFKKMLKAGVPLEAVKHKMRGVGLNPSLLDDKAPVKLASDEIQKSTPEEEKIVEKFKKMLKAGVPLEAVKHKMRAEGVDPCLFDDKKPIIKQANSEIQTDTEQEKAVSKFKKMLKAGVPLDAVKMKMKAEGIDPALLDGPKSTPTFDTAKLKKFQMMLKAGVEVAAVIAKMTQEGFSKEEQEFVTGQSTASPVPFPAPPAAANKLIALHWDPMAHTDLKDSIWGKLQGSNQIKGLGEEEMERLALMFGKKEKKEKVAEEKKPEDAKSGPPKLTVIDTTRGMNISIGLTSFKSQGITVEQMGSALNVLDTKFLNIDCLLRIKEILPSDVEVKSLMGFNTENGHPAEICLYKLSQIDRVRIKVDSMIFMNTLGASGSHLTQSLITLREVAGRILISEGLKEIMVSVLAIGNAMNQGNWKGSAVGFKLGSLIKLAQTKSTDGKNTLIDYLILVLHERAKGGSVVCEAALEIDEELSLVKKSKHLSMSEITKDCNNLTKESVAAGTEAQIVIEMLNGKLDSLGSEDEKMKFKDNVKSLEEFKETSLSLVTSVSQSLNETNSKFAELAAFFGEDPANVGSVLSTLSEFIDHFSAAKQAFNRKNRKRPLAKEK